MSMGKKKISREFKILLFIIFVFSVLRINSRPSIDFTSIVTGGSINKLLYSPSFPPERMF